MSKDTERSAWDREQIARAVSWTTCRFRGTGVYDNRPFATFAEARADALIVDGRRPAALYAITPEGWSIHVANGDTKELLAMTNPTQITRAFETRNDAIKAARAELGAKKMVGVHFSITETPPASEGGAPSFSFEPIDSTPAPKATQDVGASDAPKATTSLTEQADALAAQMIDARDAAGNKCRVLPTNQLLVNGVVYPNATRAAEARRAASDKPADAPASGRRTVGKGGRKGAAPKAAKALGERAAIQAAAEAGKIPATPDFSKPTHKGYVKVHGQAVDFVKARNLKGLKAMSFRESGSSGKLLRRWINQCVVAIEAQNKAAKGAGKTPKAA